MDPVRPRSQVPSLSLPDILVSGGRGITLILEIPVKTKQGEALEGTRPLASPCGPEGTCDLPTGTASREDSLGGAWTQMVQLRKGCEASIVTRGVEPRGSPRFASSLPCPAWLQG